MHVEELSYYSLIKSFHGKLFCYHWHSQRFTYKNTRDYRFIGSRAIIFHKNKELFNDGGTLLQRLRVKSRLISFPSPP